MMKQSLVASAMLFTICGLYASNAVQVDTAKHYPFNELDAALFYNQDRQKIESPFSTASVNTFSDKLVIIELDACRQLRQYAMQRSKTKANERSAYLTSDHKIFATQSYEQFDSVQLTQGPLKEQVAVPEQFLARLLQWTNGINMLKVSTTRNDYTIEISLGRTLYRAPALLAAFIYKYYAHDQYKEIRYIDPEKN